MTVARREGSENRKMEETKKPQEHSKLRGCEKAGLISYQHKAIDGIKQCRVIAGGRRQGQLWEEGLSGYVRSNVLGEQGGIDRAES